MEQVCHRCGATVDQSEPFCPHCGAPQLRYEAPEEPAPSSSNAPAQRLTMRSPDAIHWRDAIRVAAIIAVPAGLLSSRLGMAGIWAIWLIAGGMVVISMYRRRTGLLPTGRMGWRIGALLGLFSAVVATAADGISLVVQRFALHQGAMLDQSYRQAVEMTNQLYAQMMANPTPEVAAGIARWQHFMSMPYAAAVMVLLNAAGVTLLMLIFAAAGGALGARLTAKSAQTSVR